MPSVKFPLHARHRLDNDEDHRKQEKWYTVDAVEPVGIPGCCDFALLSPSHLAERHRKRKKEYGHNGYKQTRVEDHGRWSMLPASKHAKISKVRF